MESYACLPREAVTHFLMSCEPCCTRMRLTLPENTSFSATDSLNSSAISLAEHEYCSSTESAIDVDSVSHILILDLATYVTCECARTKIVGCNLLFSLST